MGARGYRVRSEAGGQAVVLHVVHLAPLRSIARCGAQATLPAAAGTRLYHPKRSDNYPFTFAVIRIINMLR
jgi:hypothetical protein